MSRVLKNSFNAMEIVIHTGQHYDTNMSNVFFQELNIPAPDYHLGIGGGNHGEQTGQMLSAIEKILIREQPEWVLVYGDTNSTLAGALAAAKLHIPIAHIEAGLRSFNKKMPEEINRVLTDHVSDYLFVPTESALKNLQNEGVPMNKVVLTGDIMYDAAIYYSELAKRKSSILKKLNLDTKSYCLATIHRAENTDDKQRLKEIFSGLEDVGKVSEIVLPLHPRTRKALEKINFNFNRSNILFTEPLGYLDMVMLEKHAKAIITDSGGVQKEAYFHKTPCITLRNETEWVELIQNGYNILVKDLSKTSQIILEKASEKIVWKQEGLYGDGNAALKIAKRLLNEGTVKL